MNGLEEHAQDGDDLPVDNDGGDLATNEADTPTGGDPNDIGFHENGDEVEDGGEDEDDDDDIVILSDAEGNEQEYQFIAIVEVDEEQYALLTPADAEEDETTEIVIFRYEQNEDGGETFSDVPDEETFAKVQAEAEALFAADDEENDGDDSV